MKKIVRLSFIMALTLCLGAGLMIGCGSDDGGGGDDGGGESNSGISYTGLTTQAVIDENNAEDIVIGAYQGGSSGTAWTGLSAVQTGEEEQIGRSRTLVLSRALENALRRVDITTISDTGIYSAIQNESGSFDGNCGGSASFTISVNDETGSFNGNFNFNSYCEYGTTLSGSVNFSGQTNLSTGETQFIMSFNALTIDSGSDSFTVDGDVDMDLSGSTTTITMNILMQDNSNKKVYWVENFNMTLTMEANYVYVEVSGKYYDPDYGYVVLSTLTPLRIYDNNDWPSQGVLICTGNTGIGGSSTMARLTVLSSTQYQVEADTNGDGIWNYDTGLLNWSDL